MNTEFVASQTSVPDWLMTYCRQLADVHYERRLNMMYVHMLSGFLAYEPWKQNPPFPWRGAKTRQSSPSMQSSGGVLGWVPMNMMLPNALYDRVKLAIEVINNANHDQKRMSLRTFLYTVVCWWCSSVYPYRGPGILPS